jgi:hypothetical protein
MHLSSRDSRPTCRRPRYRYRLRRALEPGRTPSAAMRQNQRSGAVL